MTVQRFSILTLVVAGLCVAWQSAVGCPFCGPVGLTFSQELEAAPVAVIVRLKALPEPSDVSDLSNAEFDADRAVPEATFEIVEILKGQEHLKDTETIKSVYFGAGRLGQLFLLLTLDAPRLEWSRPVELSDRARQYLSLVMHLPQDQTQRLMFYQKYLEDEDEVLTRDAYDEFARASYDDVKSVKEHMQRDRLIHWIQDFEIPPSRRRLYLTMLGVCGLPEDCSLLENMMRSDDRNQKAGLDAMIACYMSLMGEQSLPFVENLFLKNQNAEYTDTYSAIVALRFHANQSNIISKSRIVQALRHMLDRPQLADLVVPDLARWKDWESMPRMIRLFKESTDENNWVRVPVVNYLRQCPLPEADAALLELEAIDPDSVKRAKTFFAAGAAESQDPPAETTTEKTESAEPTTIDSNSPLSQNRDSNTDNPPQQPDDKPDQKTSAAINSELETNDVNPLETGLRSPLVQGTAVAALSLVAIVCISMVVTRRSS